MKRLFTKHYLTLVIAIGLTALGCSTEKTITTRPSVDIKLVGDPGANDITITFTPSENTSRYMFAIGTENDKMEFLDNLLPGTVQVNGNKTTTYPFDNLESKTNYTIFAVAYDESGNAGPVSMPTYGTYTSTFKVNTYYLTDNSAAFKIECTNDYINYHFYLGKASDREEFENNNIDGIQSKVETYKWIENYFTLEPDTEYVFFAKGTDRAGNDTRTFEIPIKTEPIGSSEIPNATFEITDNNFFKQYYTVTPNDKCKMVTLFQCTDWLIDDTFNNPNAAAGDIMGILDEWSRLLSPLDYMKCYVATDEVLNAETVNSDLLNDQKFNIYVILYDDDYKPYALKKFSNRTPSLDNKLQVDNLGGTITLSNPTYTTVDVEMSLNKNTFAGFFEIVDGQWLDNLMAAPEFDEYSTVQEIFYLNRLTTASFLYSKDNQSASGTYTDENMEPGKKYYMVLCPMNENGPTVGGWGKMVKEEFYTTSIPSTTNK